MDRAWQDIQSLSSKMIDTIESLNNSEKKSSEGKSLPGGNTLQYDWQTFTELESRWSQLIHETVHLMKQDPFSEDMRHRLFEIMDLNRQILKSSHAVKNEIGLKLSKIDHQKKAAFAYQSFQDNI